MEALANVQRRIQVHGQRHYLFWKYVDRTCGRNMGGTLFNFQISQQVDRIEELPKG
jgi:hypothetical protein